MKHSLRHQFWVTRVAILLAVVIGIAIGMGFGLLSPMPANAAPTHDVNDDANGGPFIEAPDDSEIIAKPVLKKSKSKKPAAKKITKKKKSKASALPRKQGFLKAPKAAQDLRAKAILGTPDPNVDEPSEMITAIKNNAQDKFWDAKRPYPEQLRDQRNQAAAPPAAPVFTGAIAQKELEKRGTMSGLRSDDASHSNTLRRVSYSEISGVTFDDQPLRLSASEPFRRSLDTVSFELGRPCKNQEYIGWPLRQSEQNRVDNIFEETNEKLKLRGYNLQPQKARSVGSDVSAFTADMPGKKLLGIWSAGDVGLLLLMCDTDTSKEDAYAAKLKRESELAAAKLAKQKASKSKKKSSNKNKKKVVKSPSRPLFKTNSPAAQATPSSGAGSLAGGNSVIGSGGVTEPDAPKPSDPAPDAGVPPLGTTAPQAAPEAPAPEPTPTPVAPLVPAPAEEPKPQVIPGAPPKDLPPEPTQSQPQTSIEPPAINPSTAFIPADAPTAAKDAAKEAVKDAVKDVVAPPVTDVKP